MENQEEEQELFKEIALDMFNASETPLEQLEVLAFNAGVTVEQSVINVCWNMPAEIVRGTLAAILVGMLQAEMAQQTLNAVHAMTKAYIDGGYES